MDRFKDFALFLREENEGTKRSLGWESLHMQSHTILAHVCRDVRHSVIFVNLVRLML